MSRDTIFNSQPPKCLRGEDKPMKFKRGSHLLSSSNFLCSDSNYPVERFSSSFRKKISSNEFHSSSDAQREWDNIPKKKRCQNSGSAYQSTYDIISFNPKYSENVPPRKQKLQASYLKGKTTTEHPYKPSKKTNPSYSDSSQVRMTFTYH